MKKENNRTAYLVLISIAGVIIVLISLIAILGFQLLKKTSSPALQAQSPSSVSKAEAVTASSSQVELSGAELDVKEAEDLLDLEDLQAAKKSVAKLPAGKEKTTLEAGLDKAKENYDYRVAHRVTVAPHPDMIIDNPAKPFGVVNHYSYKGGFYAWVPDISQYTKADIIKIFGQPDKEITNVTQITKDLGDQGSKKTTAGKEFTRTHDLYVNGTLTFNEAMAFADGANDDLADISDGSVELDYSSQGKPDVYFSPDDKGLYATPIPKYFEFPRLSDKN